MSIAQNVKTLSNELQSSLMVVQQQKCNKKYVGGASDQNVDEVTVHLTVGQRFPHLNIGWLLSNARTNLRFSPAGAIF